MRRAIEWGCAALLVAAVGSGVARGQTCVGDCNGEDMVLVNELIIGVNIALGIAPIAQCEAFDANGDGMVGINELIAGVNNALNGCGTGPSTPTPTLGSSTPTPTTTSSASEVERVFTIEPGQPFLDPGTTRSGLFTGALANTNAAMSFPPGPLTIAMGQQNASGVAPLRLKEDVDLSITVLDSTCLCMRLMAQGSEGSIDCDGGTAYDTKAVRAFHASGFEWTVTTGLGDPSGAGDANLLIPALFQRVQSSCEVADCPNHQYTDPPNVFAFTTTTATAVQETAGPPLTLEDPGAPFDCATFATPGGAMLAAPAPTTIDPVGDVANVFRFAEAATQ